MQKRYWLVYSAALCLLVPCSAGLLGAPPSRPPLDDARVADHLIQVLDDLATTARKLADLQDAVLQDVRGNPSFPPSDPRLRQIRQLHLRMLSLRGREKAVVSRMPPIDRLPQGQLRHIRSGRETLQDLTARVHDSRAALKAALRGLDPAGVPEDDRAGAPPRTRAEAGAAVGSGAVKTPTNLLEIFLQIPDAELSKGNLDYYRKQK